MKFLFNSFSYCIHKRTVNVKYSQINSFSLLFVKSPDFLSLEKKISRFFTLSGWQVCTLAQTVQYYVCYMFAEVNWEIAPYIVDLPTSQLYL
jgi:hypothetical protein